MDQDTSPPHTLVTPPNHGLPTVISFLVVLWTLVLVQGAFFSPLVPDEYRLLTRIVPTALESADRLTFGEEMQRMSGLVVGFMSGPQRLGPFLMIWMPVLLYLLILGRRSGLWAPVGFLAAFLTSPALPVELLRLDGSAWVFGAMVVGVVILRLVFGLSDRLGHLGLMGIYIFGPYVLELLNRPLSLNVAPQLSSFSASITRVLPGKLLAEWVGLTHWAAALPVGLLVAARLRLGLRGLVEPLILGGLFAAAWFMTPRPPICDPGLMFLFSWCVFWGEAVAAPTPDQAPRKVMYPRWILLFILALLVIPSLSQSLSLAKSPPPPDHIRNALRHLEQILSPGRLILSGDSRFEARYLETVAHRSPLPSWLMPEEESAEKIIERAIFTKTPLIAVLGDARPFLHRLAGRYDVVTLGANQPEVLTFFRFRP